MEGANRARSGGRRRRAAFRALGVLLPLLVLGCGSTPAPEQAPDPLALTPGTVDLDVDADAARNTAEVVDVLFAADDCEVLEGAVGGVGVRRLLRFDTKVRNLGTEDCVIGDPAAPEPPIPPDAFEFDACHGHYHLEGFAQYELRHLDGTLAAIGHKQSFCITDSVQVVPKAMSAGFRCDFQGLSSGWADIYQRGVPGQWIDVSGVPGGDYLLVISVNVLGVLPEVNDVRPDTVVIEYHLPDPSQAVAELDDHPDDPAQATEMPVPAGFEATISPADDVDWFRLHLDAGKNYRIHTALLTLPDSLLRLYDADGAVLLDENDDVSPSDPSSEILTTPLADEYVTVEVSGPNGATGTYRLIAEEVP
jgi:hypothetical protein